MEQIKLLDTEKMMFSWWLKIRWFIVLILFSIGLLRIGMVNQTIPIVAFVGAFIGISVLNILFQLQIITSNNIITIDCSSTGYLSRICFYECS